MTAPSLAIVPVGLRVEGKSVLVVGAGRIAARKAAPYVDQGAKVTVVAPEHSQEMETVQVATRLRRRFAASDLDGVWFVVTATGIPSVDREVFEAAEQRKIWCNAADDPASCSVILPAVSRHGPITVGISSGGTSPAVASWLRRRIDALLDDDTLMVTEVASRVRRAIRSAGMATEVPGWREVLDGEALELVRSNQVEQLERRLFEAVTR